MTERSQQRPDDRPADDHADDLADDRDLDAVRSLRADVPAPAASVLVTAREQLLAQDVTAAVLSMRPRRRTRRRRAMTGIAAAAAVAAVATGAFVLTSDGQPGHSQQAQRGTAGASPATIRFTNASQVLDAATAAARGSASLQPGQYRHVRVHDLSISSIDDPPARGAYQLTEDRTDTWTPAAGVAYERNDHNIAVRYPTAAQRRYAAASRGGIPKRELTWVEIDGDKYTQVYPTREAGPTGQSCTNCPDSRWDIPDSAPAAAFAGDAASLRASLFAWAKRTYADLVRYGKGDQFTVGDLAYDASTRVAARSDLGGTERATMYQVIKTIPGIDLVPSLADYDGRTGVAIRRVDTFHVEHDLIFSGNGSTYFGDRTVVRKPSRLYRLPAGTVIGSSAVTVSISGKPEVPAAVR